jgi:hypothetical protein
VKDQARVQQCTARRQAQALVLSECATLVHCCADVDEIKENPVRDVILCTLQRQRLLHFISQRSILDQAPPSENALLALLQTGLSHE